MLRPLQLSLGQPRVAGTGCNEMCSVACSAAGAEIASRHAQRAPQSTSQLQLHTSSALADKMAPQAHVNCLDQLSTNL